jgi:small subunit ribosomal protein S9
MTAAVNVAGGTGRRKTAIARVYLRTGSGKIQVNGRQLRDYFNAEDLEREVIEPLDVTDNLATYDVLIRVGGGGTHGQAGACRHGLARALVSHDETNRRALRANGMLTRDRRMVERKKYGQPKARRRFQFSKR